MIIALQLFIFIVVIMFFILLAIRLFNPKESWENIARKLRNCIFAICRGLFTEEKPRHSCDLSISYELKRVVEPYANKAFEVETVQSFNSGTPFVAVCFVPNRKMEQDDLCEVSQLVEMKFRRYLSINNLLWRNFTTYEYCDNYVKIFCYYAERRDDDENLKLRYERTIKEKSDSDFGYLRDEDLDKELGGSADGDNDES